MNRNKKLYGIGAVVIIAAVVYFVLSMSAASSALDGTAVSAAQMVQLKEIAENSSLANAVGLGITVGSSGTNYPKILNGTTALTINGKPAIVYVGADYCPFCAAARWGLVLALMRFGNVTGLNYMTSSSTDSYADTPTFSFTNVSYSSTKVAFDAVETLNRSGKPIANMTQLEESVFSRYGNGAIPFTDFGNSSVGIGAVISPQVLQGKDWNAIIALLKDPSSAAAQAIIGNANVYTAYICASNASLMNSTQCNASYVQSVLAH